MAVEISLIKNKFFLKEHQQKSPFPIKSYLDYISTNRCGPQSILHTKRWKKSEILSSFLTYIIEVNTLGVSSPCLHYFKSTPLRKLLLHGDEAIPLRLIRFIRDEFCPVLLYTHPKDSDPPRRAKIMTLVIVTSCL